MLPVLSDGLTNNNANSSHQPPSCCNSGYILQYAQNLTQIFYPPFQSWELYDLIYHQKELLENTTDHLYKITTQTVCEREQPEACSFCDYGYTNFYRNRSWLTSENTAHEHHSGEGNETKKNLNYVREKTTYGYMCHSWCCDHGRTDYYREFVRGFDLSFACFELNLSYLAFSPFLNLFDLNIYERQQKPPRWQTLRITAPKSETALARASLPTSAIVTSARAVTSSQN